MKAPKRFPTTADWAAAAQLLRRPFPVTAPMVALVSLVPVYVFIPELVRGRALHAPALVLDRLLPLRPGWALVYGSLYLFLILLPVLVVTGAEHARRTVRAYLLVWLAAYACFFACPTVSPRPAQVPGDGFGAWGLRLLYAADPPLNCFPSLHVAHSFVSALTCLHVHRGLGLAALLCAGLVGASTLFTKQHYVVDVVAGALLAGSAFVVFLRRLPRDEVPEADSRAAPLLALGILGLSSVVLAAFWVFYRSSSTGGT